MKKGVLFFLTLTLFSISSFSQDWQKRDVIRFLAGGTLHCKQIGYGFNVVDSNMLQNRVSNKTTIHYKYNSAKSHKTKDHVISYVYDSMGRNTQIVYYSSKGVEKAVESYVYNSFGYITNMDVGIHGKDRFRVEYGYDSLKHQIGYNYYKGKKLELVKAKKWVYENGKLKSQWVYKADSIRYKYHYSYEYFNDTGRLLESKVENQKGEELYRWDYRCMSDIAPTKKETKKETRICKSTIALPNGHSQEIWEQEVKGEIHRTIYEKDSLQRLVNVVNYLGKWGDKLHSLGKYEYNKDTIEFSLELYGPKTQLIETKIERNYLTGMGVIEELSTFYNRKGKIKVVWENQFTYEGKLVKTSSWVQLSSPNKENITEFQYTYRTLP